MAAGNTKFRVENGLDVIGSANVSGTMRVDGDLSIGGNLAVTLVVQGDIKPTANHTYNMGVDDFRWTVFGSSGNFSNNLTVAGDTTLNNVSIANAIPTQNNQPLGSLTRRWAITANTVTTLTANASTLLEIVPSSASFNANSGVANTTEIITTTANHGFANGDVVQYIVAAGNTAIGGLSNASYYYVVCANSTTGLQLSSTFNGTAINITAGLNQSGHSLDLVKFIANTTAITAPLLTVTAGNTSLLGSLNVLANATFSNATSFAGNAVFKTDLLFIDATNNRIGFKNASPSSADLITIGGNTVVVGLNTAVRFLSTNATHNGSVMIAGNTTNTRWTTTTYEANATSNDGGFLFRTANSTTTTDVLAFNQSGFTYKSGNVVHSGNFGVYNYTGTRLGP